MKVIQLSLIHIYKFSSAVLLVLPDLRNSAFFIYRVNDERRCRNCTSAFLRSKGDEKNAVSSKAYPCALHDGGLCAAVSRQAAGRCRLYKICAMQGDVYKRQASRWAGKTASTPRRPSAPIRPISSAERFCVVSAGQTCYNNLLSTLRGQQITPMMIEGEHS